MNFELEQIKEMIYVIRGQKVMLDSDLAKLYGVETKRLIEQVKRNLDRFPDDFMFQLSVEEYDVLRSQNATSKTGRGGRRYQPLVFTENGVAMLSTVLNSKQAIQINIAIMRIFTKLRSFMMLEKELVTRMNRLESDTTEVFKVVFEKLDALDEQLPSHRKDRAKIGLNNKKLRRAVR
ncbi:MAG: ORF6N domain-containing protein [Bacteriovoracaceae bacterium]|nr:ORF6N domain-containing protein [Bacteriovoracaceae bacterium]